MNRTWKGAVGLAMVLTLLVVAIVGTAWAQTRRTEPPSFYGDQTIGFEDTDDLGSCYGDGDHHAVVWQSLANSLGMTVDELKDQVKQSRTLADVASAKKLSKAQWEEAIKAALREMISQHVQDGDMDQAKVDAAVEEMLASMNLDEFLDMLINSAHDGLDMDSMHQGGMGGMHDGNSGGMMGGSGDYSGMMGGSDEGSCHGGDVSSPTSFSL